MARYFSDNQRHLVCWPFSVEGLHEMARVLGIARCWYHAGGGGRFPHYDVPKLRQREMAIRTEVITGRQLLVIIKGGAPPAAGGHRGPSSQ